jgi:2-polyprenyl-6-methoxyphenol hydroxylase-like FAD-dependent oxidoreductase
MMGAGLNGLAAGMLLARDGHRVTVLERDAAAPRGSAGELWQRWDRRGVNQFRQLHFMLPRWRALMERELPAVLAELEAMGGARTNMVGGLPAEVTGGWRAGDERFETVTARRPVLEAAVAAIAEQTPGLTIRRGATVTGLVTGPESIDGVPHVTGVLTGEETATRADLVVDATGRRSPVNAMLEGIGARRPAEEREDCGFVYYTRHYRSADGRRPAERDTLLQHFESVSILTLPCDSGTWGVAFIASARDKRLRALRGVPAWEAALALFPTVAHWGAGQPITDVQVIAAIEDRHRRFVVDGQPVVTGLVAVGDAWACTNPSLGRGASIGLLHACALRDLLREVDPGDPGGLARRFDEITQATVGPLYRATLQFDRHRLAEIDGEITGTPYLTPDASWEISKALYAGATHDPDVLRAYVSVASLTAMPEEALAEPGLLAKVISLGSSTPRYPAPGPSRAELLAAIDDGDPAAPIPDLPRRPATSAGRLATSAGRPARPGTEDGA